MTYHPALQEFPDEVLQHAYKYRPEVTHPFHILLVEDDSSDIMLTEMALDATGVDYDLHTLHRGDEVLPYLRHQGKYEAMPRPDLLMLDLSLPIKDGFEVLAELGGLSERFGEMPIIILTGDTSSSFLKGSHDLNVAAYLTKPCSIRALRNTLARITSKMH